MKQIECEAGGLEYSYEEVTLDDIVKHVEWVAQHPASAARAWLHATRELHALRDKLNWERKS